VGTGSGVDERQIAALWRRVYVHHRLTGRLRLDLDVVIELAATRSVLALPRLVELVLEHRARDLVAHAIVAIVEEADPMRLAAADAQVRRASAWNDLWARMTPASFEHHVRQCRDPMGVVLAGGMCRNGFVRQRAVELSHRHAATAAQACLRILLLRANDWVPQVRQAAVAQLEAVADDVADVALIRALPLVQRLSHAGRLDDPSIADLLLARASGPCWQHLLAGLSADQMSVRRGCTELALSAPQERRSEAIDVILDVVADPVSRRRAAQSLLAASPDRAALSRLFHDRSADVRLAALRHVLTAGLADTMILTDALTDRSRRVRELAQYHAWGYGIDVAAHYRACLDTARPNPTCIDGMGAVGQPADVDRVLPLTTDRRARVRAAAITAIGRLDATRHLDLLYRAVTDSSPRVSRGARRALSAAGATLDPHRLNQLIADSVTDHAITNALLLADQVDRWSQLWLYLEALPRLPPGAAALAVQRVAHWHDGYRRTWHIDPPPDTLRRARSALHAAHDTLPPKLRSDLADTVTP
jgi:hypothetical protein